MKLKSERNDGFDRRRFLTATAAVLFMAPAAVRGEILTRGRFGDREAYLKRVQDLAGALAALPRTADGNRSELRAIASTLASAVQDMLFNEAQARPGKVAPPTSGLRPAEAPAETSSGGDPVPVGKVPYDWLLLKGGAVQDDVGDLIALLEDAGEPISSAAVGALIDGIAADVAAINRPGG